MYDLEACYFLVCFLLVEFAETKLEHLLDDWHENLLQAVHDVRIINMDINK